LHDKADLGNKHAHQTIVDDDKRGRAISLYTMAVLGVAPLGNLVGGALANLVGAPATILLAGVCCLAGAVLFGSRLEKLGAQIRPI
jgi:hypothetical protein